VPQPQPSWDVIGDVEQLLRFHFMQNALLAGTMVALAAGVVGYFVVLRGQSFAGHTLSQVGFPGAAAALLLGVAPQVGLIAFCLLAAIGIGLLPRLVGGGYRSESGAIGVILAFSLALGLLFFHLYTGFADTLLAYLFGTFLGIDDRQVLIVGVTALLTLAVMTGIGRPLLYASIDAESAAARGVPARALSILFLLLLGLCVAISVQLIGTLLTFALVVTPAAAAQHLTTRPLTGVALSVLLAVLVMWTGLGVAYFTIYPVGFFTTTFAFAAYLAARAVRWGREGGMARRLGRGLGPA
jgi:zinc/manganese transport system permease protein